MAFGRGPVLGLGLGQHVLLDLVAHLVAHDLGHVGDADGIVGGRRRSHLRLVLHHLRGHGLRGGAGIGLRLRAGGGGVGLGLLGQFVRILLGQDAALDEAIEKIHRKAGGGIAGRRAGRGRAGAGGHGGGKKGGIALRRGGVRRGGQRTGGRSRGGGQRKQRQGRAGAQRHRAGTMEKGNEHAKTESMEAPRGTRRRGALLAGFGGKAHLGNAEIPDYGQHVHDGLVLRLAVAADDDRQIRRGGLGIGEFLGQLLQGQRGGVEKILPSLLIVTAWSSAWRAAARARCWRGAGSPSCPARRPCT